MEEGVLSVFRSEHNPFLKEKLINQREESTRKRRSYFKKIWEKAEENEGL